MNQEIRYISLHQVWEKNLTLTPKNLKGILGDWELKPKNPGIRLKGIRETRQIPPKKEV